ncbi:hypothetical protein EDC55_10475 [Allofrancisella inopinata]|uniref:Type VI secretion system protein ImpJ n=1 Tax=Allofrancisella inopinata TaxID=1085647 RepID=A0AAE7CRJ6_9GAMM|nr:type VI secretion system baseplate subunit TssK [Allofrancisella inopinata]QIV96419.1 hypothetical protein E4K63_06090 [Allofrancisella inopinata]TDT73402.1 hypothetical protein EDC55_10475 [Allofrancisella inopinata]
MSLIHWQVGQYLSPEHFSCQQDGVLGLNTDISLKLLNYSDGLFDIALDMEQFIYNIVDLKSLILVLPEFKPVVLGHNAKVEKYNLIKKSNNNHVSLHLNISTEKIIENVKVNGTNIKLEHLSIYFSESFDNEAKFSFKIMDLEFAEDTHKWEVKPGFFPRLIALPYMYSKEILTRMSVCINEINSFINIEVSKTNNFWRYAHLYLKLSEVDNWLKSSINIEDQPPILFKDIIKHIQGLSSIAFILKGQNPNLFIPNGLDIYNTLEALKELEFQIRKLNLIEHKICPLEYREGIYRSKILPANFFESNNKYIVIESSQNLDSLDLSLMKVFAPSEIRDIVINSINGVEVDSVEDNISQKIFPEAKKTLLIKPYGDRWNAILHDKLICIKSFQEKNNTFDRVYIAYD